MEQTTDSASPEKYSTQFRTKLPQFEGNTSMSTVITTQTTPSMNLRHAYGHTAKTHTNRRVKSHLRSLSRRVRDRGELVADLTQAVQHGLKRVLRAYGGHTTPKEGVVAMVRDKDESTAG